MYTDGSTCDGTSYGGASLVVMVQDTVIHKWHALTGTRSISRSERAAMQEALRWLGAYNNWISTAIVCVCKPLAEALDNPFPTDLSIKELPQTAASIAAGKNLGVIWVPATAIFAAMS